MLNPVNSLGLKKYQHSTSRNFHFLRIKSKYILFVGERGKQKTSLRKLLHRKKPTLCCPCRTLLPVFTQNSQRLSQFNLLLPLDLEATEFHSPFHFLIPIFIVPKILFLSSISFFSIIPVCFSAISLQECKSLLLSSSTYTDNLP